MVPGVTRECLSEGGNGRGAREVTVLAVVGQKAAFPGSSAAHGPTSAG